MSDYTLRAATREDVPALCELEKICFSDPWSEGMLLSSLTEGIDFTVLISGEEIIAYSIVDRRVPGEHELHNIAVAPKERGKGFSKPLMEKMLADTETGTRIFLEVRAKNAEAIGLYKKYGFTEIGIRKNYYKNPLEDAILMHYV